jgi:NADPH:quinone reductase-like Zn-dependent oxidoreductase
VRGCGVEQRGGAVTMLDLPDPVPGAGQIVVAVEAAGIGAWDPLIPSGEWDVGLDPPAALGVEGSGTVVAVGEGVADVVVGDLVLAHEAPMPGGSGFWAERVALNASHVALRPANLDAALAGALPVSGLTARQALRALDFPAGSHILVTGGGGTTGGLVVQVAALAGLVVTTTASPATADRLRSFGATDVIDYHDTNWPADVEGRFGGAIVVSPGTASDAARATRDGGRLVALTSDSLPTDRGMSTTTLYVQPDAAELADLAAALADGRLSLEPAVFPLADGPDLYGRVVDGSAGGTKYVLRP